MDTIVLILILLTAFNFLLKQTFWKPVAVGAAAGIATIFVILMWPYAIEQSKTQIADWLSDNQLMLDTSVVLTLEIVLQMAFCLLAVHVANYSPVVAGRRLAFGVVFPDKCFGCYLRNYCHGKRENGSGGGRRCGLVGIDRLCCTIFSGSYCRVDGVCN